MQKEITKTEWKFKIDLQGEEINLYTYPCITAKLQYSLNKYFEPAFEKQLIYNLSDNDFQNLMKASGIDANSMTALNDCKDVFLDAMRGKPLEQLTKFDFEKAVEFCILCVDKQRILKEKDGRAKLDIITNRDNWDIQDMELIEGILNQYTFRHNRNNVVSDDSVEAV